MGHGDAHHFRSRVACVLGKTKILFSVFPLSGLLLVRRRFFLQVQKVTVQKNSFFYEEEKGQPKIK